ncbi:MAG TPA: (2Fe-2S)-binding protein [Candidatus Angelobacter sp.]|nr:(2Fe-2S)-binding protein [Candidatus Angelobacter sp.]
MPAITLIVNGTERKTECTSGESLLMVLRDRLGLTGTKYGCGEGQCGACTVLLRGKSIRSCRVPADSVSGQEIATIEGLAKDGQLHPVQQAFLDEEAFQCAYCTSGMIMSACSLLAANPNPDDEDIAQLMDGNVCRCGTYPRITAAIHRAAQTMKARKS